jgi:hypothetical protein
VGKKSKNSNSVVNHEIILEYGHYYKRLFNGFIG